MPDRADLQIYQGDDYACVVTVTDKNTGAAVDLTGCAVQAQIRAGPADTSPDVIVEITAAVLPPNFITLEIPFDQTVGLCGTFLWDLQLSGPGFIKTTILSGRAQVTPEITREVMNRRLAVNHA